MNGIRINKDYLVREGYIVDEAGDGEVGIENFSISMI